MSVVTSTQDFIVTNGIGTKYDSATNVLLIATPNGEPHLILLESNGNGIGEILLTEESEIALLGNMLGGKTRAQMEQAFSVAGRGTYRKVKFSTN